METITLSGIIKIKDIDKANYLCSSESIKLIRPDDSEIDLVDKFNEIDERLGYSRFKLKYYLSNTPCTKEEMKEGWLKQLVGYIDANYEENYYSLSEWTDGCDCDTIIRIGEHDLFAELSEKEGKFIIIELTLYEPEKNGDEKKEIE